MSKVFRFVQLSCELGGQFVSGPVCGLSDRSLAPRGCWIKILAAHCWHCMHTRNGLINSAPVKERKWQESEFGLIGSPLSHRLHLPACGAASDTWIYTVCLGKTEFSRGLQKRQKPLLTGLSLIMWRISDVIKFALLCVQIWKPY